MTDALTLPAHARTADDLEAEVAHLRRFARLMDRMIDVPMLNIRVGLDGLISLIPVVGDVASAAASCYVPYRAYRLGVPTSVLAKMMINIVIDALIGIVPVLGDYLDVAWDANERNVDLLEDYLASV